jgi:hypothetical protein
MASSLKDNVNPVWLLFTRRAFSRLAYWLSALGYDLRDRTALNRIYLVYFCAFWSVWAIAVFALLGSGLANIFQLIQARFSPPYVVLTVTTYGLILWVLYEFWQVSRRSPFVFTEEDAFLLCQTPVNRRKVGLIWFLRSVIGSFIPFAIPTIILAFALVEWRFQGHMMIFLFFDYLKASLLALVLVMPLQVGLQAALWGLGALRLQRRNEPSWLRPLFFVAAILFIAGIFIPGLDSVLMAPLHIPLNAAFGENLPMISKLGGLALSLLCLAGGLVFLSFHVKNINLSKAAQETSHIAALELARSYWQFDLVDSILLRSRLGTTRKPGRLLMRSGGRALIRKDLLQSLRTFRVRELANLLAVFGLSWGMFAPSNIALQFLMAGIWTITVSNLATQRFRSDLSRWWLLRSLPMNPADLLKDDYRLRWGLYMLAGWLALAASSLPVSFRISAAMLLPFLLVNASFSAANDILRHSSARTLMSPSLGDEKVPRQNIWGVVQGLISVLFPFGILVGSFASPGGAALSLIAIPIAMIITWLNQKAVLRAYRGIA